MSVPAKRKSGPSGPTISHEERAARGQCRVELSLSKAGKAILTVLRTELGVTQSAVVESALRLYFASLPRKGD
jgi:hypothetical protein